MGRRLQNTRYDKHKKRIEKMVDRETRIEKQKVDVEKIRGKHYKV